MYGLVIILLIFYLILVVVPYYPKNEDNHAQKSLNSHLGYYGTLYHH